MAEITPQPNEIIKEVIVYKYYPSQKEAIERYREKNHAKILEKSREYYEKHKEEIREKARLYMREKRAKEKILKLKN